MHKRVFSEDHSNVVLLMQKAKNCTASHKERGTMSESKASRVGHPAVCTYASCCPLNWSFNLIYTR